MTDPGESGPVGAGPAADAEAESGGGEGTGATDGTTAAVEPETPADVAALAARIVEEVEDVIVGKRDAVEHVLVTVLARGHLLVEDVPGVGKTTLAKSVARSIDGSFKRVQFTPDLLPSDVTGVNVFNRRTDEFDFQPGPVFANVVLGDEINRAPPKTQSALLEAMEENQVTTDGTTRKLPDPFCVIATQNDVEPGQTYELPVAEVDRFTKKIRLGYPDAEEEAAILGRLAGDHPVDSVEPVATIADVRAARRIVGEIAASEAVREYVARLAVFTRHNAKLGASPRGSLALIRASQARAALDGRGYVIPDDVQAEAPSVLSHRIRTESGGTDGADVVDDALDRIRVE
ncbi:moxr-like ATPase [Halorubrum californiense DSM 19288]|uniref:Moxr-like ATPase n=1 Tax=Halorubrum californiense DSM 19288 TaxID=1227465 RepID=M0EDR6_9EURY|nr:MULTISPECIES: MoxR family ATPase [Halorubrum]ELZ45936.1 moxr-like ATPase [Halorubrum californiense DSM 19288]TKX72311.1 MoxR family ATPase [Halorubrum sp. GN11GM_10-3_MGM]